jgi:hypothetical protein
MVRIIAYACLAVSGTLAAVYGYSTGNSELYGLLRAGGWGMVAVVGGCAPTWLFHHLDARSYGRALATALAGAVCFCVTIYGSMGGITGSSDRVAAERARAAEATKDDRAELKRIAADRTRLPEFRPIGTVEADLVAARAGRPFKSSDSCAPEKITTKSAREGCEHSVSWRASWRRVELLRALSSPPLQYACDWRPVRLCRRWTRAQQPCP